MSQDLNPNPSTSLSFSCIGHAKDKELYFLCYDRKTRAASAQSFTLWQQATIEITCRAHSISACSRHMHMGRRTTRGHLGHLPPPPKFSEHGIAILTSEETFK